MRFQDLHLLAGMTVLAAGIRSSITEPYWYFSYFPLISSNKPGDDGANRSLILSGGTFAVAWLQIVLPVWAFSAQGRCHVVVLLKCLWKGLLWPGQPGKTQRERNCWGVCETFAGGSEESLLSTQSVSKRVLDRARCQAALNMLPESVCLLRSESAAYHPSSSSNLKSNCEKNWVLPEHSVEQRLWDQVSGEIEER